MSVEYVADGKAWRAIVAAKKYVARAKKNITTIHQYTEKVNTIQRKRKTTYVCMASVDGGEFKPVYMKM